MSYETTTPTGETQTFSLMDGKSYYLNCDCMELLRKLPDKSIGLCVTDPPYGDGGVSGRERTQADSEGGSTATRKPKRISRGGIRPEEKTENGIRRTGGTWAAKFGKKS